MHVLEDEQSGHQPCRQRRLPRPGATDRTEASRQEVPIDLRRQPHQRMAKVDDLLQRRTKQIVLTIVARLAHGFSSDSESRRQRNHEPPKSGIPKRKKTETPHGFLAKSNTCSGQITATDQSLPNSSRANSVGLATEHVANLQAHALPLSQRRAWSTLRLSLGSVFKLRVVGLAAVWAQRLA